MAKRLKKGLLNQVEAAKPKSVVPVRMKPEHLVLHTWINSKGHYGFKSYLQGMADHCTIIKAHLDTLHKNEGKYMWIRGVQSICMHRALGLVHFIKTMRVNCPKTKISW